MPPKMKNYAFSETWQQAGLFVSRFYLRVSFSEDRVCPCFAGQTKTCNFTHQSRGRRRPDVEAEGVCRLAVEALAAEAPHTEHLKLDEMM